MTASQYIFHESTVLYAQLRRSAAIGTRNEQCSDTQSQFAWVLLCKEFVVLAGAGDKRNESAPKAGAEQGKTMIGRPSMGQSTM